MISSSSMYCLQFNSLVSALVYISQLIRFARVSSYLADFKACNKLLLPSFVNRCIGT